MFDLQGFNKENYISNKKIIIYGAGMLGEVVYVGLKKWGLMPSFFMDKNLAGTTYMGLPVISPVSIKDYKEEIFIIASLNYLEQIMDILRSNDVIHIYDIRYFYDLKFARGELSKYSESFFLGKDRFYSLLNSISKKTFIIDHCEMVVTEKCTLRCRDCSNLIPYYKKPKDTICQDLIRTFNNFLDCVSELLELRILGGETFLYKELGVVLREYISNDKVKSILIYTNCTVLPSEEWIPFLKNPKVAVWMSDYGRYSYRIDEMEKLFREKNIKYFRNELDEWHLLGNLEERDYTDEKLKKMFGSCNMARCFTFHEGKFYLCPRCSHGEKVGAYENCNNEYVDFSSERFNCEEKRNELKNLINETEYLTACKYCNGESVRSERIAPAVQL